MMTDTTTTRTPTLPIFQLGRQATAGLARIVHYRADGWVRLSLGQDEANYARSPEESRGVPLQAGTVHYHPLKQQSWGEVLVQISRLSQTYGLPIHGLSPQWLAQKPQAQEPGALEQLKEAGLTSLCWPSGELDSGHSEFPVFADWDLPKIASFLYTPISTQEQVNRRVLALLGLRKLQAILPLPIGLGDRVLVTSLTTEGSFDAAVTAWTQMAAQQQVPVGASWGSLGWKMAQPLIAFGCNRLTGWGIEETIAYGPKARPNSWIGQEEVQLGIAESAREAISI